MLEWYQKRQMMTGTKCIDLTDRSRKEKLSADKEECRRLKVCFYYPGEDDPNRKPIEVLNDDILEGLGIRKPDLKFIADKKDLVGTSDPKRTMDPLNQAVLSFFDRYLKDGDADNRTKLKIDESVLLKYEVL